MGRTTSKEWRGDWDGYSWRSLLDCGHGPARPCNGIGVATITLAVLVGVFVGHTRNAKPKRCDRRGCRMPVSVWEDSYHTMDPSGQSGIGQQRTEVRQEGTPERCLFAMTFFMHARTLELVTILPALPGSSRGFRSQKHQITLCKTDSIITDSACSVLAGSTHVHVDHLPCR